jgi:hypothetical protein
MLLGSAGAPADTPCRRRTLGEFSICVPAPWQLERRGSDSASGRFTDGAVRLEYDFGLYSDPLKIPQHATDTHEKEVTAGGLAARQVAYTLPQVSGAPVLWLGLHVPRVRQVSMGWLKLTLLAQAADPRQLQQAAEAMATVRFNPAR